MNEKKKRRGGPSGQNRSPVLRVPSSKDEETAYKTCAALTHKPFAAWARDAMNKQAIAQGINPPEKLNDVKADN